MPLETLLTPKQAADVLGVSVKTLEKWRSTNAGPHCVRLGRLVRYRPGDILAWLEHQTKEKAGRVGVPANTSLIAHLPIAAAKPLGNPIAEAHSLVAEEGKSNV